MVSSYTNFGSIISFRGKLCKQQNEIRTNDAPRIEALRCSDAPPVRRYTTKQCAALKATSLIIPFFKIVY